MIGSQYGQDALVLRILGHQRGGYFLDSGACDGLQASNTVRLERESGWTGICVEPDPRFFALLERERTCICVSACLDVISGEAPFVAGGTLGGLLSGFDAHGLAYLRHHRPDAPVVTVPTQTIRQVLDNAHAPPVIDYWSLDTEGSERALLPSFPWDRYTLRVLTGEHKHHHHRREAIRCLMESKGFARFCEFVIDDCYVNTRLGLSGGARSNAWR